MNNPIYGVICLCAILIFILILAAINKDDTPQQPIQQQGCVVYDDFEFELHFGGKGRERIEDDKIYKNYFKY